VIGDPDGIIIEIVEIYITPSLIPPSGGFLYSENNV
jgi:hypothetical protein